MASRLYQSHTFKHLRAVVLAAALSLLGSALAYSQTRPAPRPSPTDATSNDPGKSDSPIPGFGSPESEMREKLRLKAEKKEYDENVARAREAAQLATQLAETYAAKQTFTSGDAKKLERLEKLTKKIRNEAGGSETDPEVKDIPNALEAAVKRVAEIADDLRKLVETTPRHVISAAVIDEANKLLGVIQRVRASR